MIVKQWHGSGSVIVWAALQKQAPEMGPRNKSTNLKI